MRMNQDNGHRSTRWERNWAMTAHLSALSLYLGLLFANLLLPYLIWRWKRSQTEFVAAHALAALNFQITLTVAGLVTTLLAIFIPLFWAAVIVVFTGNIIYIGMAADRAREGRSIHYPLGIRWIRPKH